MKSSISLGALTDERTYKQAFSIDKSFEILEEMGGALDQYFVKIFKDVIYAEFQATDPAKDFLRY